MWRSLSAALIAGGCGVSAICFEGPLPAARVRGSTPLYEAEESPGRRRGELYTFGGRGEGESISAGAATPRTDALGGGVEQRLVVYNGTLVVRVADVDEALKRARETVSRLGGWMQSMKKGEAAFRVPARSFEQAMDSFASLGVVVDRAVSGSDVTDEYRDLELRLKNALALREKFAELLKKAEDVETALKVEKELARLTEEIERLEGRLRALADRVAYSTVTLKLVKSRPEGRGFVAWTPFDWVRRLGAGRLFSYW